MEAAIKGVATKVVVTRHKAADSKAASATMAATVVAKEAAAKTVGATAVADDADRATNAKYVTSGVTMPRNVATASTKGSKPVNLAPATLLPPPSIIMTLPRIG
jgi:hypothetical protein